MRTPARAAVFGARPAVDQPPWRGHCPPVRASEQLVPVTVWVHPDRLIPTPRYRAGGGHGVGTRNPYALGGLVIGVGVVSTLVACLVMALAALVAWVSAHALVVGVGAAVVALTALVFLRAVAPAGGRGRRCGGWCGCE